MLPSSHPAPILRSAPLRKRADVDPSPAHAHFGVSAETFFLRSELAANYAALENSRQEAEQLRARVTVAHTAVATMAHEIRNPLASLELFTELLGTEPARAAEILMQMRAGLRSLHGAVSNVLRFYENARPRLQPVVLGRVVASAVEFARPLVDRAGLDLRLRGASLPGEALADEGGLRQLVLNLVSNAVRHTAAPGAIHIALTREGGRFRLAVRDTGEGIAPEHFPHIFRAGWSGAGSTGLGLAVAQQVAREHDGTLKVKSKPGEGATFTLEIPAHA